MSKRYHICWDITWQPMGTADALEVTKHHQHSPVSICVALFMSAPSSSSSSSVCIWLRTRHKPARLIEQTWEPDTFIEKQAGLLADKRDFTSPNCELRSWNSTNFSWGSDEHLCVCGYAGRGAGGSRACSDKPLKRSATLSVQVIVCYKTL